MGYVLQSDGVISPDAAQAVRDSYKASLNTALTDVVSYVPPPPTFEGAWKGMVWPASPDARQDDTGLSSAVLKEVGEASVHIPGGFVSAMRRLHLYKHDEARARHRKYISG
jgi:probable 2-oxoglutarate dehydrogenase E1 component DHKTD1